MDFGLDDTVTVITGASRGIGRAIALAFAREGSHVAIGARSEDDLNEVANLCEERGVTAVPIVSDLSTKAGVSRLIDRTLEEFGTVDTLVNNVGGIGEFATFEQLDDQDWMDLYELNVMSMVRATRRVLPTMKENESGSIINISSESGSQPDPEMPHYNATKAAIKTVAKSLSKQYGEWGIRINTVSPALVKATPVNEMLEETAEAEGITIEQAEKRILDDFRPHIELGRVGKCEEVASVVLFLASEEASFVHGADYRVDGGSVASVNG